MVKYIHQLAELGRSKELNSVFAGSLDVDPTFVTYADDYQYCREHGLLDEHVEKTPFELNRALWNISYLALLKQDLRENFSEERMEHMKEVARVVFADKVKRLEAERVPSSIVVGTSSALVGAREVRDSANVEGLVGVVAGTQKPSEQQAERLKRIAREKAAAYEKAKQDESQQKPRLLYVDVTPVKKKKNCNRLGMVAILFAVLVLCVVMVVWLI